VDFIYVWIGIKSSGGPIATMNYPEKDFEKVLNRLMITVNVNYLVPPLDEYHFQGGKIIRIPGPPDTKSNLEQPEIESEHDRRAEDALALEIFADDGGRVD
jgi:hypothetical protein